MAVVPPVNEGSEAFVVATHTDKDNNPVTPSALRYRVDDVRSGTMILDWTVIAIGSPGTSHEITITGPQNAMINSRFPVEPKIVTVETTSASGIRNDVLRYNVINLRAVA